MKPIDAKHAIKVRTGEWGQNKLEEFKNRDTATRKGELRILAQKANARRAFEQAVVDEAAKYIENASTRIKQQMQYVQESAEARAQREKEEKKERERNPQQYEKDKKARNEARKK